MRRRLLVAGELLSNEQRRKLVLLGVAQCSELHKILNVATKLLRTT